MKRTRLISLTRALCDYARALPPGCREPYLRPARTVLDLALDAGADLHTVGRLTTWIEVLASELPVVRTSEAA